MALRPSTIPGTSLARPSATLAQQAGSFWKEKIRLKIFGAFDDFVPAVSDSPSG
jgi:uncharacterized protein (DUF1800 family)